MPPPRQPLSIAFHSSPANPGYEQLLNDGASDKVRRLDERARQRGIESLNPKTNLLARIGTEFNKQGRVTKNGYGVLHLPWLAQANPGWAEMIRGEVEEIRKAIKQTHGVALKYLIWAGMGGSAEDKAFYLSAGLLKPRVRVYLLDSTDPAKLRAILDHIEKIDKQPLAKALRKCLVVGMAMGMTSYEPVVNLEKLDELYGKLKIPNQTNFIYMTLPGSVLDRFASSRGFRRVELQPDNGNSTAGRHSGPLTRGSLYPLALNGCNLDAWMKATFLGDAEIDAAFRLAGFIEANAAAGRDKLTLFLPAPWHGGAIWTKQDFEESLGKSEKIGIKVAINEKLKLVNYWSPKEPQQDRCFLVVNVAGLKNPDTAKVAALRRAGYPLAVLKLSGQAAVARYMQFIHYVVFGLGYLRKMNFVTQPGVELYKKIAAEIHAQSQRKGGIQATSAWKGFESAECRVRWRGGLTVNFDPLCRLGLLDDGDLRCENGNAAAIFAKALGALVPSGKVSYGELTYFGDTRYNPSGKRFLAAMNAAADTLFRSRLKMPADVYEGPAMNHSYHEMIIGYGHGLSIPILSERQASIKRVGYTADYHQAQWLATQQALHERGRAVIPMTTRDLSDKSCQTVKEFFSEVAHRLPRRRG